MNDAAAHSQLPDLPAEMPGLTLPEGVDVLRDAYGPVLLPKVLPPDSAPGAQDHLQVSLLPEFGLLNADGAEAINFLNGQTTNDVVHLATDGVQLDGYCTPKGRLIASFITWRHDQGLYMAIARDLAAPVAKRLSMFVLRAKLKVRDESALWLALGLQGPGLAAALARLGVDVPSAWRSIRTPEMMALALPDATAGAGPADTGARVLLWIRPLVLQSVLLKLEARLVGPQRWRLADIEAGLPRIVKGSSELFVPQMVNFDLISAVNFKKGCYPGQEVVARSQYLGKLKRRMFKGTTLANPEPGADIHVAGGNEAVGQVVMAAPRATADGSWAVLAELTGAAARDTRLTVDGKQLELQALPYEVPIV